MKSILQLIRRPMKTGMGILLVTLAVVILVAGVGQYGAAVVSRTELEENYDTIGILSQEYLTSNAGTSLAVAQLPEECQNFLKDILAREDLVKAQSYTGGLSAYIPALEPENFSWYEDGDYLGNGENIGNPYRCAMLEVRLDQIASGIYEETYQYENSEGSTTVRNSISLLCRGTVTKVIAMEEGFASPVGKTIALTVKVYDEAALEALQLEAGQRFLVYGMDYADGRGTQLMSSIATNLTAYEELFGETAYTDGVLDPDSLDKGIDCCMTVWDYSAFPVVSQEQGQFLVQEDVRRYYQWENGSLGYYDGSAEEFIRQYAVPTMTKLNGTAEAFLSSEEGDFWRTALEELQISLHGFPVLAVEKLQYQVAFARETARIVSGRDFTQAERREGSKVCILSETLAARNGLSVGDTIEMQNYGFDFNIAAQRTTINPACFPSAGIYSRAMGFTSQMETYTIVGLYRQNNAWDGQDAYGFTPNTIFIPKAAASGEMFIGTSGVYYTLVLQNGKMEAFGQLQKEAGFPDLFICYDQGYSRISKNLNTFQAVTSKALYIAIGAYAAILLLYLILFPMEQKEHFWQMRLLGAGTEQQLAHSLLSNGCIVVIGGILGGIVGSLSWERISRSLMQSVSVDIPLNANLTPLVWGLVTAHCLVSFLLVGLTLPLTTRQPMGKKKGKKTEKKKPAKPFGPQMHRRPGFLLGSTVFAMAIALALGGLNRNYLQARQQYEEIYENITVRCTVTNLDGTQSDKLNLSIGTIALFTGEKTFAPEGDLTAYLTDLQIKGSLEFELLGKNYTLAGITSTQADNALWPDNGCVIQWHEGEGEHLFEGSDTRCLIPQELLKTLKEWELSLAQLEVYLPAEDGAQTDSTATFDIAGTYVGSETKTVYIPWKTYEKILRNMGRYETAQSLSAAVIQNRDIPALREAMKPWFTEPNASRAGMDAYDGYTLALDIQDSQLTEAENTLQKSLTISAVGTALIFLLSAGTGAVIGGLMIRSRKREIRLMRTLGTPDGRIFGSFALEQLLCVVLGVVLGGAAFLWRPLGQLLLFVVIYALGLNLALLVFLRKNLMATIKEDE